jgi:hypothetical protein
VINAPIPVLVNDLNPSHGHGGLDGVYQQSFVSGLPDGGRPWGTMDTTTVFGILVFTAIIVAVALVPKEHADGREAKNEYCCKSSEHPQGAERQ